MIICYILYVLVAAYYYSTTHTMLFSIVILCYFLCLHMGFELLFQRFIWPGLGILGSVFVQFGPIYHLKTSPVEPPLER